MDNYEVKYIVDGKEYVNSSPFCEFSYVKKAESYRLTIQPKKPVTIISARIKMHDSIRVHERFFSNGYQTWTDSEEQSIFSKTKKMGFLGRIPALEKAYHFSAYGDYSFIEYHRHYSFSFTYLRNKGFYRLYGSKSEKNGYTVFYIKGNELYAYKDNKGIVISSETGLFDIFYAVGDKDEVFNRYAASFNKELAFKESIKGFTTWYRHYENITEEKVYKDLESVASSKINFEYFQIDDGYESQIGDWEEPDNKKFPNGFAPVVKSIKNHGLTPGIWLAPFVVSKDSEVYKAHSDWVLLDKDNKPLIHGSNWGGTYILDIEKSEVKEHLVKVFKSLMNQGFELFKLDFLYAVSLGERNSKSRGQIMTEAMEFLREVLKGKKILACGVPLFPCFFNVDYCRIGTDISLIYNDVFYMRFCHRERISSKLSIKNTIARSFLNKRFFLNDPDVILLKGTKMKDKQKKKIYDVDKKYGSVFFTSDDLSLYTESDKKMWEKLK